MFKPGNYLPTPEPNHRCSDCGRMFFNVPAGHASGKGNSQCYACGNHEADHGEDAGLYDPFDPSMEE
jgi:hypothetical protein